MLFTITLTRSATCNVVAITLFTAKSMFLCSIHSQWSLFSWINQTKHRQMFWQLSCFLALSVSVSFVAKASLGNKYSLVHPFHLAKVKKSEYSRKTKMVYVFYRTQASIILCLDVTRECPSCVESATINLGRSHIAVYYDRPPPPPWQKRRHKRHLNKFSNMYVSSGALVSFISRSCPQMAFCSSIDHEHWNRKLT